MDVTRLTHSTDGADLTHVEAAGHSGYFCDLVPGDSNLSHYMTKTRAEDVFCKMC